MPNENTTTLGFSLLIDPKEKPIVPIYEELKDLEAFDKVNGTTYASELTLHRMDYQDVKAAGFESPGELLAVYKRVCALADTLLELINKYK